MIGELPRFGLGNWRAYDRATPLGEVERLLAAARDLGVGLLDTANNYQGGEAEEQLGRALAALPHDAFVVTTKGGAMADGSICLRTEQLERDVEGSLRRLRRETIDVYQVHHFDAATPLAETLGALEGFVKRGKIRAYGCANFGPLELLAAEAAAEARGMPTFATVQVRYNVLERRRGEIVFPIAQTTGARILVYGLLAEGLLTGRYRVTIAPKPRATSGAPRAESSDPLFRQKWLVSPWLERANAFADAAERAGRVPAELAIAFVARDPSVACLVLGVRSVAQLESAVAAAREASPEGLESALAALASCEAWAKREAMQVIECSDK